MSLPKFLKDKIPSDSVQNVPGEDAVEAPGDDAEILSILEGDGEDAVEPEDGPDEESGELPEDDTEESEPEDEQAEEETEQKEEVQPTQADPRDSLIEEQKRQIALLYSLVDPSKLQNQQQAAPAAPPAPTVPKNVLRTVLFGGDRSVLDKVPAETRAQAEAIAERYAEDEIRYVQDPEARYREQFQERVVHDVFKLVKPILEDYHGRAAQEKLHKQLETIKDPAVRRRAVELFQRQPGARSVSWEERGATMELAVQAAEGEALRRIQSDKAQKRAAGKAQAKATGGGTLKPGQRAGGAPAKSGIPDMAQGESVLDYYKRVEGLLNNKNK